MTRLELQDYGVVYGARLKVEFDRREAVESA